MSSELQSSDAHILNEIVQHAHLQYLKESRVHHKTSFNILRMLSAYKELSHSFKMRKQNIYNWIIYITKQYNPQTMNQWIAAISDISGISTNYQSRKTSFVHDKRSKKRVNTTINEFYRDYEEGIAGNSKIMSRNSTTRLQKNWEFGKSRDFSYDSKDKIQGPISCKMHYISFEPDNKQNMNSENMRENEQSKTPAEQSFILNLPNSSGSPFYLSKITHNTKQITELYEHEHEPEPQDEEWENMKARADIFYSINSKMKAFSALMANFQAFDEYKEAKRKADFVVKQIYFFRFFDNMRIEWFNHKTQTQLKEEMISFSKLKLMKKSFKILQVFYQLKITDSKKKIFNLAKTNPVNFQFLISLMLAPLVNSQQNSPASSRVQFDTPKSIRHKARHFQQTENSQKIELIFQYFSKNLKLSKQQIKELFHQHHLSKLRKSFNILRRNQKKRQEETLKIQKILKKNAMRTFIEINNQKNIVGGNLITMKAIKNRNMKEKCFKALLEICLSKKIYAKREEYLIKKNKHLEMKRIVEIWKRRMEIKQLYKFTYETRVMEGATLIKKTITNKFMSYLFGRYTVIVQEEHDADEMRNQSLCKQIFEKLKERVEQKKIYSKIRDHKKMSTLKKVNNYWKKIALVSKGVNYLNDWSNKRVFSEIKAEKEINCKTQELERFLDNSKYHRSFHQLRVSFNLDHIQEERMIKKVQKNIVLLPAMKELIEISRFEVEMKKKQKENVQLSQKSFNLEKCLRQNKVKEFIRKMKDFHCEKRAFLRKTSIIEAIIGFQKEQVKENFSQSSQRLSQLAPTLSLRRSTSLAKKQFINLFRRNLEFLRKQQILNDYLTQKRLKTAFSQKFPSQFRIISCKKGLKAFESKKNSSLQKHCFQTLKNSFEDKKAKVQEMRLKIEKRILFNCTMGLAKMVMRKDKRINELRQIINESREKQSKRKFMKIIQENNEQAKKQQICEKFINFRKFVKNCDSKESMEQKIILTKQLRMKSIFIKLSENINLTEEKRKWNGIKNFSEKRWAVQKVNRAIIRQILNRKETYMAIKFRAMQLCRKSFKAFLQVEPTQDLITSKLIQGYEHFSTQYSSI